MKQIIVFIWILSINYFVFGQLSPANDPNVNKILLNKTQVSKIGNKRIDFYLNHPQIDKYSKMYYRREFAPSDDAITFGFLDSVFTNNKETRPFYFFIFNQIVNVSDGALTEGIAFKCLDYVTKYPSEFINFSQNDTLIHVERWIGLLSITLNDKNINRLDRVELELKKTNSSYLDNWINFRKKIKRPD
jgi:hypothetical protein